MSGTVYIYSMQVNHVMVRHLLTEGHNPRAQIFNVLFNPVTIPPDLLWKNVGGDTMIKRTELPGLPTVCDFLGRLLLKLNCTTSTDWNGDDGKKGWR